MTAVVLRGDARRLPLPDASVDLIVTSPPYFGLRSYTDNVKCYDCIQMEYAGRDPRQAWPDYDAHVRDVHIQHYGGQIGSESTPAEWVAALVECTREWVRVLKPSGSLFVNLGDKFSTGNSGESGMAKLGEKWAGGGHSDAKAKRRSAAVEGLPPKTLLGLPWRYALACVDELGLILRRDIIWSKPNGLPESVTDRCRSSHEYVFHLTVRPRYYAAVDEIREPHTSDRHPGVLTWAERNARSDSQSRYSSQNGHGGSLGMAGNPLGKLPGSVWSIPSQPLSVPAHLGVDHFAAFPMELPRRCILGWSPPGVCTACGEGRRPVGDRDRQPTQRVHNGRSFMSPDHGPPGHGKGPPRDSLPHRTTVTITGYACGCPDASAPTRPALIVDPFGGTGTTALVASMYGRVGVSVDLSADYCRLARWRVADPAERARALLVPTPPPVPDGQGSLFDEAS